MATRTALVWHWRSRLRPRRPDPYFRFLSRRTARRGARLVLHGDSGRKRPGVRHRHGDCTTLSLVAHAFYAVVAPGIVLGIVALFMRDPTRGQADALDTAGHGAPKVTAKLSDYLVLLRIPSYLLNCAGMAAMTFAIGGISYWMPRYLVDVRHVGEKGNGWSDLRRHHRRLGLSSTLLGGLVGDYVRRWIPSSYFLVSGIAILIACPFILLMMHAASCSGPSCSLPSSFSSLTRDLPTRPSPTSRTPRFGQPLLHEHSRNSRAGRCDFTATSGMDRPHKLESGVRCRRRDDGSGGRLLALGLPLSRTGY